MASFDHLLGNPQIVKSFKGMIETCRLPHALLFHGPRGVGKNTIAKAFITDLHSRSLPSSSDPFEHPDVRFLSLEGKQGNHSIDTIHAVMDDLAIAPYSSPYKILVIEEVDRMLPVHGNALLKTIEEPPPHVIIILLTTSLEGVLPTIVSRCIGIPFFPLSEGEITQFLMHKKEEADAPSVVQELTRVAAQQFALLSGGSIGRAEELLYGSCKREDALLLNVLEEVSCGAHFSWIAHVGALDEHIHDKKGGEELYPYAQVERVMQKILFWYRDLHVLAADSSLHKELFYSTHVQFLQERSSHPLPSLERVVKEIESASEGYRRNIKLKHCLENLFLRLENGI